MDDAFLVRRRQPLRDLHAVIDHAPHRQRTVLQRIAQRAAFQQLAHQVGRAVERAELEDREDVGMVERRGRLRLLLEAAQPVRRLRNIGRKNLDGDVALEHAVARAIHLAHSTGTERAENLVLPQFRSRCHRHE